MFQTKRNASNVAAMQRKEQSVKKSQFINLVGNMSKPVPGDSSQMSCVFFYDPNEAKRANMEKL